MINKNNLKLLILGISILIFTTGCAPQSVKIQALKPATVAEMADKKKVAVVKFENDKVGLSAKVEAQLAKKIIDKKRYFTVVNRSALNKIISEQKLQHSELLDASNATTIGKLAGAEVIITGTVTSDSERGSYYEDKVKCLSYYKKGGGCARYHRYQVHCKTASATVSGTINIIDVQKGTLIHAEDISKEYSGDTCKDGDKRYGLLKSDRDSTKILSKSQAVSRLTNDIAYEFASKLSPKYVNFKVNLIEELKIENLTQKQKSTFKNSLKYIANGRNKKAERMLERLHLSFNEASYELAYNLAVTKEANGKLKDALRLYILADELSPEPNKNIDFGIQRVEENIISAIEARKQLAAK